MSVPFSFKRTALIAFVALVALPASAQVDGYFMARYQMGVPLGDFRDYIEKNSWRGFSFGYRWIPDETVSAGIDMAWQGFNERKDYDTYENGTASISGVQYRYQNTFQISGQVEYVLLPGSDIRPYLGMGVGGLHVRRLTSFGLFEVEQNPWQFMLKPGLGCSFYTGNGSALLLGVDYLVGFKNAELGSQSNLAVTLGFLFASN